MIGEALEVVVFFWGKKNLVQRYATNPHEWLIRTIAPLPGISGRTWKVARQGLWVLSWKVRSKMEVIIYIVAKVMTNASWLTSKGFGYHYITIWWLTYQLQVFCWSLTPRFLSVKVSDLQHSDFFLRNLTGRRRR